MREAKQIPISKHIHQHYNNVVFVATFGFMFFLISNNIIQIETKDLIRAWKEFFNSSLTEGEIMERLEEHENYLEMKRSNM